MFHSLVENFDRSSHRADHAPANNSLRQLQMMKTENVHPFVEVEHAFGYVMQTEELLMTAIKFHHRQSGFLQLVIKLLAQAGPDVQEGKKARRVQTAAVTKPRTNQVIVEGRDGLKHVQHGDWILQLHVGSPDEPRGIRKLTSIHTLKRSLQFKRRALHQELGGLVHDLESQLVRMTELCGGFLQCQQFVRAQVALIV